MKDMYIVDVKSSNGKAHHQLYLLATSSEEAVRKAIAWDKKTGDYSEKYGYSPHLAPMHPAFK